MSHKIKPEHDPDQMFYNTCQITDCQCKSCGNSHNTKCLADTGNCYEATFLERCPISGCPMFKLKDK
ncbi:MAG: hypothetical protein M0T74_07860 [Desulfitobacterium hafniense]|nr:hypothetical protein [Desulfitobacterium hafniense]